MCNGDLDRCLKFECIHYKTDGNHTCIGELFTTARQLIEGPGPSNTYPCINPQIRNTEEDYKHSGEIHLMHSEMKSVERALENYNRVHSLCIKL